MRIACHASTRISCHASQLYRWQVCIIGLTSSRQGERTRARRPYNIAHGSMCLAAALTIHSRWQVTLITSHQPARVEVWIAAGNRVSSRTYAARKRKWLQNLARDCWSGPRSCTEYCQARTQALVFSGTWIWDLQAGPEAFRPQ